MSHTESVSGWRDKFPPEWSDDEAREYVALLASMGDIGKCGRCSADYYCTDHLKQFSFCVRHIGTWPVSDPS